MKHNVNYLPKDKCNYELNIIRAKPFLTIFIIHLKFTLILLFVMTTATFYNRSIQNIKIIAFVKRFIATLKSKTEKRPSTGKPSAVKPPVHPNVEYE